MTDMKKFKIALIVGFCGSLLSLGDVLAADNTAEDLYLQNCATCHASPTIDLSLPSNWNGWGNDYNNQRFQSSAGTNISIENVDQLELAWAFGLENSSVSRAQPTVLGNLMLMGSPSGMVEVGTNSAGNPILAPSGAPIWQAPTIDPKRNRIYVGTGQNYTRPTSNTSDAVIAFNMDTGNIDWVFQSTGQDAFTMACATS
jgi:glucose dehydrogenase